MKAWRRTVTDNGLAALPPIVLTALEGEFIEASQVGPYVGTHFVLIEVAPAPVGPWVGFTELPISSDPQNVDLAGEVGNWVRGNVTTGDAVPLLPWSNVVQVIS